jgi:hypothetical protein
MRIGLTVAVLPTERPVIAFENPLTSAMKPSPLSRQLTPYRNKAVWNIQNDQGKSTISLSDPTGVDLYMMTQQYLKPECSSLNYECRIKQAYLLSALRLWGIQGGAHFEYSQ